MTLVYYVLEYRAGDKWFPATNWDGRVIRYDNVSAARQALAGIDEAPPEKTRWRIVSVEEIRTPL